MKTDRPIENLIAEFVRSRAGACEALVPLAGDASMRRYFRASAAGGSFVVCYDETLAASAEGEHQFLVVHSLFERHGVPVPLIHAADRVRGLLLLAAGTVWFDKKGIDTVVDGSAYTVRNAGRVGAKVQNGNLQDYLALAAVLALCVFGLVWYFG